MSGKEHRYEAHVVWEGNRGEGTSGYDRYGRQYRVMIAGKPDLVGSADVAFRGEPGRHNPEDLFLASISGCHMLTYLALCAKRGVHVLSYEDTAVATMREDARGGGHFEEVVLRPTVMVASEDEVDFAARLHDHAHEFCFIANSCRVPIRYDVAVQYAAEARA